MPVSSADLLLDAFARAKGVVHDVADGLTPDALATRVEGANSIAWLLWHLTRVQDDHVAEVAGTEQVWRSAGWARRFDLPFDDDETGYGMTSDQVTAVTATSDLLIG